MSERCSNVLWKIMGQLSAFHIKCWFVWWLFRRAGKVTDIISVFRFISFKWWGNRVTRFSIQFWRVIDPEYKKVLAMLVRLSRSNSTFGSSWVTGKLGYRKEVWGEFMRWFFQTSSSWKIAILGTLAGSVKLGIGELMTHLMSPHLFFGLFSHINPKFFF